MATKRVQTRRRVTPYHPSASGGRILNCLKSRDTENDWPAEAALRSGIVATVRAPASEDLRQGNQWWDVGDQGQTGSCVGWASADSVLRWHFVNAGRLGQRERLSVRFVWMAAKETDQFVTRPTTFIEADGTSLKAALDIARRYGVVLDPDLPFKAGELYPGEASTFYSRASMRRISSYYKLSDDPAAKLPGFKNWIATVGPILTRLDVDATWMNVGNNGVLDKYKANQTYGGHAVAIVGYNAKQFIIRNSWGPGWGDHGYAYASPQYALAAFSEAYGVVV